jgi:hypothetical protein
MICRGYRQGALAQIHLISNDKSSAVINNLNGFRICDRWGKEEKRSQDGVPNSQRGDFTYMSLRLGGWDRRLIQDHGGAVRKGGGWEVLPKRRGREELRHRRVERELIRDCSSRRRARAKVNGMHFGRKGACSGVPVAPVSSVPAAPPASAANIMSVIGRREQERRYLVARENELCFANRHLSNERDGP